jgi:hypothetical protein
MEKLKLFYAFRVDTYLGNNVAAFLFIFIFKKLLLSPEVDFRRVLQVMIIDSPLAGIA